MSYRLFFLLVVLPTGVGIYGLQKYGLSNEGMSLFGGVIAGELLIASFGIFSAHYGRVRRHQNALFSLQMALGRNWTNAKHNLSILESNINMTTSAAMGVFGTMIDEYSEYSPIEDALILELANVEIKNDLMRLNNQILDCSHGLLMLRKYWDLEIATRLGKVGTANEFESVKSLYLENQTKVRASHLELLANLDNALGDTEVLMEKRDAFTKWMSKESVQKFPHDRIERRRRKIQEMKGYRDKVNKPISPRYKN